MVRAGQSKFGTIRRELPNIAQYIRPKSITGSDSKVILKVNEVTLRDVVQRSRGAARRWIGTTLRVPTTTNLATFTCRVKLYDEYKVTVSQDLKGKVEDDRYFDFSFENRR
jgi:hypothetical protein